MTISTAAKAAQDAHRRSNGKFGEQPKDEPTLGAALTDPTQAAWDDLVIAEDAAVRATHDLLYATIRQKIPGAAHLDLDYSGDRYSLNRLVLNRVVMRDGTTLDADDLDGELAYDIDACLADLTDGKMLLDGFVEDEALPPLPIPDRADGDLDMLRTQADAAWTVRRHHLHRYENTVFNQMRDAILAEHPTARALLVEHEGYDYYTRAVVPTGIETPDGVIPLSRYAGEPGEVTAATDRLAHYWDALPYIPGRPDAVDLSADGCHSD